MYQMNVSVSNFVNWEYTTRFVRGWFGLPYILEKLFRMIYEDMKCMLSDIWDKGTCTARICDHCQAIDPAKVKEEAHKG